MFLKVTKALFKTRTGLVSQKEITPLNHIYSFVFIWGFTWWAERYHGLSVEASGVFSSPETREVMWRGPVWWSICLHRSTPPTPPEPHGCSEIYKTDTRKHWPLVEKWTCLKLTHKDRSTLLQAMRRWPAGVLRYQLTLHLVMSRRDVTSLQRQIICLSTLTDAYALEKTLMGRLKRWNVWEFVEKEGRFKSNGNGLDPPLRHSHWSMHVSVKVCYSKGQTEGMCARINTFIVSYGIYYKKCNIAALTLLCLWICIQLFCILECKPNHRDALTFASLECLRRVLCDQYIWLI